MSASSSRQPYDVAERALRNPWVAIAWALSLFFLVIRLWWIRNLVLICWVYGADAYFQRGVRVMPGKPIRFSTGALVPVLPDMVTGFGFFLVIVFGFTGLLILGLRLWGRIERRRPRL